jgi:hypothetical protein
MIWSMRAYPGISATIPHFRGHFVLGQVHAQFFNCTEEAISLVMVDSNGGDEIGTPNSRDMCRVKGDAKA